MQFFHWHPEKQFSILSIYTLEYFMQTPALLLYFSGKQYVLPERCESILGYAIPFV